MNFSSLRSCLAIAHSFPAIFHRLSRRTKCSRPQYNKTKMCVDRILPDRSTRQATLRLCKVSGHTTELLEIQAENPSLHVLFIPGNPGIVRFYKEHIESLYELLGGAASVTAIGHISQTIKDYEHGRLFSLKEQIDHKMDFMDHELQNNELPIILVGHSVGSYISIEMFKRAPEKVIYCIGLYPFIALNPKSSEQTVIKKLAESRVLSVTASLLVSLLGLIPTLGSRFMVKRALGKSWSDTAVDAACSHLVKYHIMRNILFMAMTEFEKLGETPDWGFMKAKQRQLAFLFGIDDHWGPLTMFEEISEHAPDTALTIEEEGHTHAFSCTEAGSLWVAQHVASLIKNHLSRMQSGRTMWSMFGKLKSSLKKAIKGDRSSMTDCDMKVAARPRKYCSSVLGTFPDESAFSVFLRL